MIQQDKLRELIGGEAVDRDGKRIGKIGQIFLDDTTGEAEWATVNTGMFGTKETFVPISAATHDADGLRVPYEKDKVKDAPNVDVEGGHLDEDQEQRLYDYYGIGSAQSSTDRVGHDTSGPTTDGAMTRSEERLRVGTENVQTGKARLRKWVETENVTVTVPIRTERARLETEPITDANRDGALAGPDLSDEEHEVVLSTERPIVTKETVPVERVRLIKDVEQVEEKVSADVSKEQIELDGDVDVAVDGENGGGRART